MDENQQNTTIKIDIPSDLEFMLGAALSGERVNESPPSSYLVQINDKSVGGPVANWGKSTEDKYGIEFGTSVGKRSPAVPDEDSHETDPEFLAEVEAVLQEHSEIKEVAEPSMQEMDISPELAAFMDQTMGSIDLQADEKSKQKDTELHYPFVFIERITSHELNYYSQCNILLSESQISTATGVLDLAVKIEGEYVKIGTIVEGLQPFLLLKRLDPEREIYWKISPTEEAVPLDPNDLNIFLLQGIG